MKLLTHFLQLEKNLKSKKSELINLKEFANKYYSNEFIEGSIIKFPEMAETFKLLVRNGFDDFYRGETLNKIFSELKKKVLVLLIILILFQHYRLS